MDKSISPFLKFPTIETARLKLRNLRQEDDKAVFAYKSQKDDQDFPRLGWHKDISESQRFIAECLRKYYSKAGIYWGITEIPNDAVIGTVALCSMHGDFVIEHRAEISCAISKSYRRRGIMKEARIAIIDYAFSTWDCLMRIHSEIAIENKPSLEMNLKLGFVNEGTLRSYQRDTGRLSDIHILSLLRSDWENNPHFHPSKAVSAQIAC
jgi:RimJ/RimL family protein N-acetyltransferase